MKKTVIEILSHEERVELLKDQGTPMSMVEALVVDTVHRDEWWGCKSEKIRAAAETGALRNLSSRGSVVVWMWLASWSNHTERRFGLVPLYQVVTLLPLNCSILKSLKRGLYESEPHGWYSFLQSFLVLRIIRLQLEDKGREEEIPFLVNYLVSEVKSLREEPEEQEHWIKLVVGCLRALPDRWGVPEVAGSILDRPVRARRILDALYEAVRISPNFFSSEILRGLIRLPHQNMRKHVRKLLEVREGELVVGAD